MDRETITMITGASPDYEPLRSLTRDNRFSYCRRHNYKVSEISWGNHNVEDCTQRWQWMWVKLDRILQVMNEKVSGEWLFWMDIDAVITNHTIPVEAFIDSSADIIMTKDEYHENAGIMLLRCCQPVIEYIENVRSMRSLLIGDLTADSRAMAIFNKLCPGQCPRIRFLPQRIINAYHGQPKLESNWRPGYFIGHAVGGNVLTKTLHIEEMLRTENQVQ